MTTPLGTYIRSGVSHKLPNKANDLASVLEEYSDSKMAINLEPEEIPLRLIRDASIFQVKNRIKGQLTPDRDLIQTIEALDESHEIINLVSERLTTWYTQVTGEPRTAVDEILAKDFEDYLGENNVSTALNLTKIVTLLKERATFVSDLWEQGSFFFEAPDSYDAKAADKAFKTETPELLQKVVSIINATEDFSAENLSEKVKGWITAENIGFGKVMMPLRLALVGEMKGPDVFDILSILGKDESISRIEKAMHFIDQK